MTAGHYSVACNEGRQFPKCVFLIVITEFCERFSFSGMRSVLSIYLTDYLLFSESHATIIYHTFIMFAYFCPLIGAIVADSYWGKFNTIFYLSIVFSIGSTILSLSAITPLHLPHREFAILGLFLIAVGTGGIKPCVSTFGADQFEFPQQYLSSYYSLFVFAITVGMFVPSAVTPVLRTAVHCFGEDTCFPLAFGVPAVLMVVAMASFCSFLVTIGDGKPHYKCLPPTENLIGKVIKCIWYAIKRKVTSKTKVDHWLDYSSERFSKKFTEDMQQCLKVLLLFVPIPVVWALGDQVGSAWTFLARRMDNDLGFYTVPPDQTQVLIPLFALVQIPLLHYFVYPVLKKFKVLDGLFLKMTFAGVMVGFSFVASATVSRILENNYSALPSRGVAHLRLYNTLPCDVVIYCTGLTEKMVIVHQGNYYENVYQNVSGNGTLPYHLSSSCGSFSGSFEFFEGHAVGYYLQRESAVMFVDDVSKDHEFLPRVRAIVNTNGFHEFVNVTFTNIRSTTSFSTNSKDVKMYEVSAGTYQVKLGEYEIQASFLFGGVYAILAVATNATHFDTNILEVTAYNTVNILWLIPQYFFLALGEIIFTTTGYEFAYSQSPVNMKSLITAAFLLTSAVGNLIVVIVASASLFQLASHNFFFYAGLMFLDMVLFWFLARKYKFVQIQNF